MISSKSVRRTILPATLLTFIISSPLTGQITAVDDGSVGVPFATTGEDTLLDTSGGLSVFTNDTGTLSLFSSDSISAQGASVSVNADGTFSYDPTLSGAAQALGSGGMLTDTFTYTIVETPTLVGGVTFELNASTGVNNWTWAGLSVPVAPTGTGIPSLVTAAYPIPNKGTRATFNGGPGYDLLPASFEFWVKPDVVNADQVIFETGGAGVGSAFVVNDDATVTWLVRSGTSAFVQSSTTLVVGQWYHIVGTFDKNNPGTTDTVELFIDGVSEGTATGTNVADWSGGNGAGLGGNNSTTAADNLLDWDGDGEHEVYTGFTGQIAVARFFSNKVLTPAEVTSNRNAILTGVLDTATVTVEVTGVNDAPRAANDVLASPTVDEDSAGTAFTANLLTNDGGVLRNAATGTTDLLLWEYDAAQSAGTGVWENVGPLSGANADWTLTGGVTLNASPTTGISGITAAYDFDGVDGVGLLVGAAPEQILGNTTTTRNAAFEIWVKPSNLTQTATFAELGGGTGSGIAMAGNLLVAGSTGGSALVTYDLLADPQSLLGAGATSEYFQVMAVFAVELGSPELRLFVNGTFVGSAPMSADWCSTDASGMGRFGGANVGGILNGAAGTAYDTYFAGSIAIARLYGSATAGFSAFSGFEARQNFDAVGGATDLEGDSYTVAGIVDGALALQGIGNPATIASGAIVTLDNATGSFTYNPNGAFASLPAGVNATDTFTYRISDGNGGTGDAVVTVSLSGNTDSVNDTIAATEALVTNFTANQIVGNDQHTLATSDAFFSVDAASVSGSTWLNIGSGGSTFDVNVTGGTVISPPTLESNFGAVGAAYRNVSGSVTSVQSISGDDATFEVWFKPTPLQTGKQVLLESGGNGNGMSIVFDADANTVIFTVDGGNDTLNNIIATATGVVTGEFNQLIAVYDQDDAGQAGADSLTLYLNKDPAVAFDATVQGSGINAASLANNWSGSDASGIGATSGTAALNQALSGFLGDISIVRIYSRKLSTVEMEANFDSVVQEIVNIEGNGVGVSYLTALGATVTLNADGSFDYDGTTLTADIPDGNVVQDTFDYTISDGEGGTSTATVTVDVTGVDNSFLAQDDDVAIGEGGPPMAFAVLGNDTFTTATVELQSLESDYGASYEAGTIAGDLANALSGNWSYLWNAPTDWTGGIGGTSVDASTGGFGVSTDYEPLIWSGIAWTADGDDVNTNGDPSRFLKISDAAGGHPGLGSTTAGSNGNNAGRGPIAAYTVTANGVYGIGNSILTKVAGTGDGVSAEVYVDDTFKGSFSAGPGSSVSFDGNLGALTSGQTIYIGVDPGASDSSDTFNWSFDVLSMPSVDSQVQDIIGSVTTDGTTITYDPGATFDSLKVGQSVLETLTYTINDGVGGTSTASLNITVNGVNDAPIGIADGNSTAKDATVAGNVLTNDTDVDAGESATLVVSEVEGLPGNVGGAVTLASGAEVTLQSDGSYVYDPKTAFASLELGDADVDSFTYLVQDENGLDDTLATTVTIDILGTGASNAQPAATNVTQTITYPILATGVLIDPAILVSDPNDGIASAVDALFLSDGVVTTFPGGGADADETFTSPASVANDGFSLKFAYIPTTADVQAGIVRVLYQSGGTFNGHGVYLYEGIPHLVVKMNGAADTGPDALFDADWTGDGISIPLTAGVLPVGEATDISLIFSLDQVEYTVNGGAIQTQALANRGGKNNWVGNLSATVGVRGANGNNGGSSETLGLYVQTGLTTPEGPVTDCRVWNASAGGTVEFAQEFETATLVMNPAEGALSVPAGASFDGAIWTYTGTPSQVNAALGSLEFQPNGNSPVDISVDIRDGQEDGAVPVTGTLTFQIASAIEDWRFVNYGSFLDAGTSADTANGDGDILVNLLEFGFGTDPTVSDAAQLAADGSVNGTPLPFATGGGGVTFDLYFNRRDDAGASGSVIYTVEFSADLINFHASTATQEFVADSSVDPAYHVAKVPYPLLVTEGKPTYARVKVTVVP